MFFKNKKNLFSNSGFTLIELMVVIAIIAVLVVLSVNSFQSSQTRARDAQRKNDLAQISRGLESYYNDYGEYPDNDASNRIQGCNGDATTPAVACDWGGTWSDANGTVYMIELPSDPRSYLSYHYESSGQDFQLYARLENSQDKDIPTVGENPANYGILCGASYNCNYGIASNNTTPEDGRMILEE